MKDEKPRPEMETADCLSYAEKHAAWNRLMQDIWKSLYLKKSKVAQTAITNMPLSKEATLLTSVVKAKHAKMWPDYLKALRAAKMKAKK